MSTNVEILSFSNTFFKYLCSFAWFDTDKQNALMKRYHIGSTEQGEQVGQPIFWHVNDLTSSLRHPKFPNSQKVASETAALVSASWSWSLFSYSAGV